MSVDGQNLKRELLRLSDSLPQRFESFVENLKELKPLVRYYDKFRQITVGKAENDYVSVPVLRMVQEKGNVTVFEWKNGFPPSSIERRLISFAEDTVTKRKFYR